MQHVVKCIEHSAHLLVNGYVCAHVSQLCFKILLFQCILLFCMYLSVLNEFLSTALPFAQGSA